MINSQEIRVTIRFLSDSVVVVKWSHMTVSAHIQRRGEPPWPGVTSHDFSQHVFGARKRLTFVALVLGDLFRDVLDLQQQFDTLNGGDGRLGDGGRDATGGEVLHEGDGVSYSQNHFGSGSKDTGMQVSSS